jgi:hypothetical protein
MEKDIKCLKVLVAIMFGNLFGMTAALGMVGGL